MSTSRQRSRSKKEEQSWLNGRTLWAVGGVLALIIAAPLLWGWMSGDDEMPAVLEDVVQEMPDEGRDHVAQGTEVDYDSDPPTSGPHYPSVAPPDLYREVVPDEMLVHNLEHGHVIVYYHPSLSDESARKISELTSEYDGQWDAVLAVPRPEMEYELTLTAWNVKMELEEFDEELIDAFVDAFRGKGPENPVR